MWNCDRHPAHFCEWIVVVVFWPLIEWHQKRMPSVSLFLLWWSYTIVWGCGRRKHYSVWCFKFWSIVRNQSTEYHIIAALLRFQTNKWRIEWSKISSILMVVIYIGTSVQHPSCDAGPRGNWVFVLFAEDNGSVDWIWDAPSASYADWSNTTWYFMGQMEVIKSHSSLNNVSVRVTQSVMCGSHNRMKCFNESPLKLWNVQ